MHPLVTWLRACGPGLPRQPRLRISPPSLLHIRVDDASAPTTASDLNKVTFSSAVSSATPLLDNTLQKRGRHLSPLRRGRQRPPRGVCRRRARNLWLRQVGVALERQCRRGARNSVGRRQVKELHGEPAAQSASEQAKRVDHGRKIMRGNKQGVGCMFVRLAVLASQQLALSASRLSRKIRPPKTAWHPLPRCATCMARHRMRSCGLAASAGPQCTSNWRQGCIFARTGWQL